MAKWEYNAVKVVWIGSHIQLWQPGSGRALKDDEALTHINGLGMDGWELMSTSGGTESDVSPDFSPASILWFKRQIEEFKRPKLAGVLPKL
jgi:hypothetical protein